MRCATPRTCRWQAPSHEQHAWDAARASAARAAAAVRARRAGSRRGARAAASANDDVAWLGSRFAAGAEQRALELRMASMKERLASEADALFTGACVAHTCLHTCTAVTLG